nr:LuxR C-terminal-related transcriptional regulator [uncultured Dyadobacter sp.]
MQTTFDLHSFRRIWRSETLTSDIDPRSEIIQSNPLLEETLRLRKASVAVIDLQKMRYLCSIGDLQPIIGWSNEVIMREGVAFFLSKLEPVDYTGLEKMSMVMTDYVTTLSPADVGTFKSFFDFRMVRPNGERVRILQEGIVLQQDTSGNILLLLALISDISHLKRSNRQHLRLATEKEEWIYVFENESGRFKKLENLSKRELEIAKLVGEKMTSQEIAERLFLSTHTINTHRQNMMKKTGMADMMEINSFLTAYKFL